MSETVTTTTSGNPKRERIRSWTEGVPVEPAAWQQLEQLASLSIVQPYVAVMPDVHVGKGATVGSVVPTVGAVIPAAVGVDIGCGMMAVRTSLDASQLPDSLKDVRSAIERAVPHGRTNRGGPGDRGAWSRPPPQVLSAWSALEPTYQRILGKHPKLNRGNDFSHLGTLGTGNHFVELCLDEQDKVWVMLHSGSRGVGNRIGSYFIELAKADMEAAGVDVPDRDLSYLTEGTKHFEDYVEAVEWAQQFAMKNRELMMDSVLRAVANTRGFPPFEARLEAVNCHHNYVSRERHAGRELLVTRKGAVRARKGELGIIPGSMGTRSYIVRGKGNPESFESCSHGAGRVMSRTAARKLFSLEEHAKATAHVECRKDAEVLDETPGAYKSIDQVMKAQQELVDVVHVLKQVVCVKG